MASSDDLNLGLEELGQLAKSAAGDFSQLSAAVKSFASSPMIKDKLENGLSAANDKPTVYEKPSEAKQGG